MFQFNDISFYDFDYHSFKKFHRIFEVYEFLLTNLLSYRSIYLMTSVMCC